MSESNRQLAAVMFTDLVGYTALMQENEQKAKEIRDRHRRILEPSIRNHNGKILQYYGDGTLCMFGSASEAVDCAVVIQRELQQEPKIPLRIGIHMGDIVYDDEGVYGDSVNIASRIESLSVPGAVLVSDKIYDEIKNKPHLPAKSLGVFELKNVKRPVEVYAVTSEGLIVPKPEEVKGKAKDAVKTIAVLPFVNMSADPENEYFSDGITEELINALTKVDGLQVTSRTSSFAFKGKQEDIREIGSKLSVTTVLEGSVRKAGDKVRISAQLINTRDGYHAWSEVYDRKLEDIFEVQDEISREIANKLKEQLSGLTGGETAIHITQPLVKTQTENIEAYNLFLKGRFYWYRQTPEAIKKGIQFLEQAIALEPEFAAAYSALANCYSQLGAMGLMNPALAAPKAKQYAEKALSIDDRIFESHMSVALVRLFIDWNWREAKEEFGKAIELNPGTAEVYLGYHYYLVAVGRFNESVEVMEKAAQLDPLSLPVLAALAESYDYAGMYTEAVELCNKILELDTGFRTALEIKGLCCAELGDFPKAIAAIKEMQRLAGSEYKCLPQLGMVYAKAGMMKEAYECLEKLKKRKEMDREVSLLLDFTALYVALNDLDNAMDYLEKAAEERIGGIIFVKAYLQGSNLQSHPRFKALMKRIGLE